MAENKTKVIVITFISGGGKTETVRYLQNILPSNMALYFDYYEFKSSLPVLKI